MLLTHIILVCDQFSRRIYFTIAMWLFFSFSTEDIQWKWAWIIVLVMKRMKRLCKVWASPSKYIGLDAIIFVKQTAGQRVTSVTSATSVLCSSEKSGSSPASRVPVEALRFPGGTVRLAFSSDHLQSKASLLVSWGYGAGKVGSGRTSCRLWILTSPTLLTSTGHVVWLTLQKKRPRKVVSGNVELGGGTGPINHLGRLQGLLPWFLSKKVRWGELHFLSGTITPD